MDYAVSHGSKTDYIEKLIDIVQHKIVSATMIEATVKMTFPID